MTKTLEKVEVPQTGFFFDAENHDYYMDGRLMTGCTSIIGVINKPALIQWAANQACEHITKWLDKFAIGNEVLKEPLIEIIKEARTAHAKRRDKRAEEGTDTHALVERYVKICIETNHGYPIEDYHHDEHWPEFQAIGKFIDWACSEQIRFLASEEKVYSKDLFIAGTYDLLIEKDGKKYIADIKTSKGIYPTHFYQMAGYRIMLRHMGREDIVGAVVIKLNGGVEAQWRYEMDTDEKAFMGALAIYRANATYETK